MSLASELTNVATNLHSALEKINIELADKGGTASETMYGIAEAIKNLPRGTDGVITPVNVSTEITMEVIE